MNAPDRILERLREVGFETRPGPISLFEEGLPMLVGAAWDERTAQLAVLVDVDPGEERDVLRQVLFAIGGMRHQLSVDGPIALGSPLALLIVDEDGEHLVRSLVEEISRDYAVFTRLDLSLIRRGQVGDDELLDDALAPLLPRCRRARGESISKADVLEYWDRLRDLIEETANGLGDLFAGSRKAAGDAAADALIGDLASRPTLSAPTPVGGLMLKNFRSFLGEAPIALAPVTVVHGANGTGKSALLEALEICWAGTSQRKPPEVDADEYARHLAHDGDGRFEVVGDGEVHDRIVTEPEVELVRCVLTQDAGAVLVGQSPERRFVDLLALTGLELPEVDQRTEDLVREAKKHADSALREAGLPPLRAINSDGVKHLNDRLRQGFVARAPSRDELSGLEDVLVDASGGAYARRGWKSDAELITLLEQVDEMLAATPLGGSPDLSLLDSSASAAKGAAVARREHAGAMRRLLDAMPVPREEPPESPADEPDAELPAPIPRGLAARWLGHGRSLESASRSFADEAGRLQSSDWSQRLSAYAQGLQALAKEVPRKELEAITGASAVASAAPPAPVDVPEDLFRAAGFPDPPDRPADLVATIEEYDRALGAQASTLEAIAVDLESHPTRGFADHADRVLSAMCSFELARRLRPRKGSVEPLAQASEEEVERLLRGRLAPIVRELLASLVRFEWYFKPPQISSRDGELEIGGIATDRADLDARLVLNAAEREVFGLAWFLALYVLQPDDRRRVLAIDDASAAFDPTNRAAFVSTLRALARLVRPEQVVVCSHDAAVAESLAEELAPVRGWPAAVGRIRCGRNEENLSTCTAAEWDESDRDLAANLARLGLAGQMPTVA